jgi:hypothetical protein
MTLWNGRVDLSWLCLLGERALLCRCDVMWEMAWRMRIPSDLFRFGIFVVFCRV